MRYIPKKYIGQNIRLIDDVIEYTEQKDSTDCLMFVDKLEKAFDSLEWQFMLKTLEKFNFGPKFIKWVIIMYKDLYLIYVYSIVAENCYEGFLLAQCN